VITQFSQDDDGYERWINAHTSSYVLNCANPPSPDYIVLHYSTCRTITGQPTRGASWTSIYQKVCADSISEVDSWAKRAAGATPSRCRICHP
jgi:hypothetical protein